MVALAAGSPRSFGNDRSVAGGQESGNRPLPVSRPISSGNWDSSGLGMGVGLKAFCRLGDEVDQFLHRADQGGV